MKNDFRVSIIIPIYNVEKYIDRCLTSVINQTYSNLEIILVDDGSTDNCPDICDEYARKDSRIKVIHKVNGGLSDARNVGCKYATGMYIWYVDSDDEIINTAVEELVNIILKYKADVICFNFKELFDETNEETDNKFYSYSFSKKCTELTYKEAISDNIYRIGIRYEAQSKIYKSSIAKQIEFPVGKLAEDFATFYKFLRIAKKIIYYDNQIYVYYKRKNSIMGNKSEKLYIDIYNNELDYYNEVKSLNLDVHTENKAEENLFRTLIKTYIKIYKSENSSLVNEVKTNLYSISFKKLNIKFKLLYLAFRINCNFSAWLLRKLYREI